jgi:hypothetical protein
MEPVARAENRDLARNALGKLVGRAVTHDFRHFGMVGMFSLTW